MVKVYTGLGAMIQDFLPTAMPSWLGIARCKTSQRCTTPDSSHDTTWRARGPLASCDERISRPIIAVVCTVASALALPLGSVHLHTASARGDG